MIIECDNSMKEQIAAYIGNDYYKCLYLYIDMIKYGCRSSYTHSWMQVTNGKTTAVLLSYHTAMHIYSAGNDFNIGEMAELLIREKPSMICAAAPTIRLLQNALSAHGYQMEIGHIGRMQRHTLTIGQRMGSDISPHDQGQTRRATMSDINEIASLLYEDEGIGSSYTYEDLYAQMRERLSDNFVRSYVITCNQHVVAHVGTGAELPNLCTINYVITSASHRGEGLASRLFHYACHELLSEGKEIFSIYYPEESRRLHHKIGFKDVGEIGKLYINIH